MTDAADAEPEVPPIDHMAVALAADAERAERIKTVPTLSRVKGRLTVTLHRDTVMDEVQHVVLCDDVARAKMQLNKHATFDVNKNGFELVETQKVRALITRTGEHVERLAMRWAKKKRRRR